MLWNDIVPVWYYCLPVCSDGHKSYLYQLCGRVSDVSAVCPAAKKTEGIPVYSSTWNRIFLLGIARIWYMQQQSYTIETILKEQETSLL